MNEKHKLLISTDMINSWREHNYCTENTIKLSVAHTGIGLEVHNEDVNTWSDNRVRELIAVKVLNASLLNTTVVAFKILPLGSYALMPGPSPPFKTILELFCGMAFRAAVVLLLMSSMSSKRLLFNISFIFGNRKKSLWAYPRKLALTSL